jgi:sugar O-acyltransferase (sialic acid O-acetyltransferase NeuD family)
MVLDRKLKTLLNMKVQENSVAIVGWEEGSAGQIHSWLEKMGIYHIACFVNPTDKALRIDNRKIRREASQFSYPTKNSFKDKPLLNSSKWAPSLKEYGIKKVLITTDDLHHRFKQIHYADENDFELINAVHPTALVMEDAIIKKNVILNARAFVGYRAEVFSGSIIDSGSQIDHHCVIKYCVTIDPGVVMAGNVTIGDFSTVHTGSVIKNRIQIGNNSIIGAGSVIVEDVPNNVTVVGVPGKIIRHH